MEMLFGFTAIMALAIFTILHIALHRQTKRAMIAQALLVDVQAELVELQATIKRDRASKAPALKIP